MVTGTGVGLGLDQTLDPPAGQLVNWTLYRLSYQAPPAVGISWRRPLKLVNFLNLTGFALGQKVVMSLAPL
ncbi:hypothetical protein RRG08_045473 [Elysia crispata]|uniref:Uncharacterized protein n=1 Tax=Elysia crispata TaxID=231223 RepID=A0AAE1AFF9_9GAST|nr:hypothetical protein RRG08_045473 [Elysia crispata]